MASSESQSLAADNIESAEWLSQVIRSSEAICRACESADVPDGESSNAEQSADHEPSSLQSPLHGLNEPLCGIFFENQDSERALLGRALHDSTGQLLLTLSLNLAQFRALNQDRKLDGLIDEMSVTVDRIHREIRDAAFLEYPAELTSSGLVAALSAFVRGFAKRTGLAADFHARDVGEVADARIALALLRIGQEALVNAFRHAHPSTIHVTLARNGDALKLTITDDGSGMPEIDCGRIPCGIGLLAMRQRAKQLGGDFSVTRLNPGTKLVVHISDPVRAA